ncbi:MULTISPECIES: hypothetical protein [unclassified Sulfitobacter]|uniref:hypothetical protein n=2 Tax=unclassified Sulfitobacter TaxID=196795 RepID=UPI0023E33E7B|nr:MULTISPECIES: hypothetical protein [unclassified Sulfitobacter]MDF3421404.1 hypothetical protein [Sulfitobacter sp. KE43]MDF3472945.1 hypothetical protein [Sulfitobacter sp. M48]MDF3515860.1 hypothetical protein [Sulfitobacter sp. M63]MDF3413316.1 hypothetical protein [Sulfitobacter sp. KE5]MDF3431863.1 hypothetical protein [Sulfitobacter sp. KE42]
MEWLMYLIGAIAIGGVALAIYERCKHLAIVKDDPKAPPQHSDRQAHNRAEAIRTALHFGNGPHDGQ